MQKRLNPSICRFGCGLQWAKGCTSSIVFARWRQCALMGGHVAGTCQITLNHPSTAAMHLMANYFDHLLDTPTFTVTQTAKHFEPSTVLWPFHTIHHLVTVYFLRSPYVIGQTIIFLPCGYYLSIFFISSPNLSGRRLDVYHTSTHGVALVRI